MTNDAGKSDSLEVPRKSLNNAGQLVADAMEGRGLAKGNLSESNTHRTQSRDGVPSALERIRQAARKDRKQRFTSILHHVYDFLVGKRYVLIDRDPLYTEAFRRILGQGGVNAVKLPARSPNLNAFAERFVLSIKTECLDRLILWARPICGVRSSSTRSTIMRNGTIRDSTTS